MKDIQWIKVSEGLPVEHQNVDAKDGSGNEHKCQYRYYTWASGKQGNFCKYGGPIMLDIVEWKPAEE